VAQFRDTENWSGENKIQELYETIDVDFYEKARTMVRDKCTNYLSAETDQLI
jgi:hypothetical protein